MKKNKNTVTLDALNAVLTLEAAMSGMLFVIVEQATVQGAPFRGHVMLYRQPDGSFGPPVLPGQKFVYLMNPFGTQDPVVATEEMKSELVSQVVSAVNQAIQQNPEVVKKESFSI